MTMDRNEILQQLSKIFIDVLDDDGIVISESTSAADIAEWDSLNHIMLVVEIENHFGIKFKSNKILSWKNVGEMIDTILER
jgi:acyl carrier protein